MTTTNNLDASEARSKIETNIDAFLARINHTPEHALLKCDTGLGKSVMARAALPAWITAKKALGQPHRVIWAVPFHRLSDEALLGFQGLQISAMVWRGREAINPRAANPGTSMCLNLDAVKEVQNAMGDVAKMVCGKENGPQCSFRARCAYLAQKNDLKNADVVIVAHEILFQPTSLGDLAAFGLVVIDETFYSCGLPNKIYELSADTLITRTKAMPAREHLDQKLLLDGITKFKKHLAGMPDKSYFKRGIARQMNRIDFAAMSKIEWTRKILLDVQPGMSVDQIRSKTEKTSGNQEISKRAAMWKILEKLQLGEPLDSRISLRVEEDDDSKKIKIRLNLLKPMHDDILSLPILYMDATPTLNIARSFLPELKSIADIRAKTPYMRVVQIVGTTFGKSITPAAHDTPKIAKEKAARIKKLVDYVGGLEGTKLLVTYKDLKPWFEGMPEVRLAHFNALAGLDCFGDVDHLVVIGRPFAPSTVVHSNAECFSGEIIKYENPVDTIVDIDMRDGTKQKIKVKDYVDPHLKETKRSITDAEVIQAVGRARGVNRTASNAVTVHLFSDVHLPYEIDHVAVFRDLLKSAPMTNAQRKQKSVDKKKVAELTAELTNLNSRISVTKSHIDNLIWQNVTKKQIPNISMEIQVDLFDNIYSPCSWTGGDKLGLPDFVEWLKERAQAKCKKKEDNQLYSPAIFDPKREADGKKRGLENIEYLDGIWLDNDGGDLTIGEFVDIFPEWQMYIFNSFSSGKPDTTGKPVKKWRCFIPVSYYLTASVYKHVMKIIKKRLVDNGYCQKSGKLHGFDTSKFTASSLFYLPCQSGYGDSFFLEFIDDRNLFNPFDVIESHDVEEELIFQAVVAPAITIQMNENASEALRKLQVKYVTQEQVKRTNLINHARDECIHHKHGEGHKALFKFAVRLREFGFDRLEAKMELDHAAQCMKSPSERRQEVAHLLKQFW